MVCHRFSISFKKFCILFLSHSDEAVIVAYKIIQHLLFIVVISVVFYAYRSIIKKTRSSKKQLANFSDASVTKGRHNDKLLLQIIFILCPYTILCILLVISKVKMWVTGENTSLLEMPILCLLALQPMLNPVIYTFSNKTWRIYMGTIIRKNTRKLHLIKY